MSLVPARRARRGDRRSSPLPAATGWLDGQPAAVPRFRQARRSPGTRTASSTRSRSTSSLMRDRATGRWSARHPDRRRHRAAYEIGRRRRRSSPRYAALLAPTGASTRVQLPHRRARVLRAAPVRRCTRSSWPGFRGTAASSSYAADRRHGLRDHRSRVDWLWRVGWAARVLRRPDALSRPIRGKERCVLARLADRRSR